MVPKYSGAQCSAKEPLFAKAPNRAQTFILVTDADGLTRWVNGAFERVMGYTFEEVEGQKPEQVLEGPGTAQATARAIACAFRARQPIRTRILSYKKNGTPVWLDLEIRPLLDDAAHHVGFIHSGRTVDGRALTGRASDAKSPRSPSLIDPIQSAGMAAGGPVSPAIARPAARSAYSTSAYRVLVAEDHPINLKLVAALLHAAGCEAHCVQNGRQALAELDNADFDLVIMDSLMPVMTGIEAIAVIRSRSDWKRFIPILSLTAHAMKGAEEYHTSAGADLYMSKPLRSDCFIGAVNLLAKQGRELYARNAASTAGISHAR
jgi:PAS domain S-box-containing protein